MKKKEKCYLYIRVSTAMQVDGYSLDAQKDRLVKFAEFQGMEIIREYCDAGKSGKSIIGRPQFQKMLQDVADDRDGVSYILVFKLSRFGRNAADVLNSLQYIQDYGVNLICVEDGIDSSKDSGKLTITVLSAVAEIERENILVQTMEGRRQKAREGKWNGGQAPFGYLLDSKNSTLIVNPEEAEIVRLIFEKFVHTDLGTDSISKYLEPARVFQKEAAGAGGEPFYQEHDYKNPGQSSLRGQDCLRQKRNGKGEGNEGPVPPGKAGRVSSDGWDSMRPSLTQKPGKRRKPSEK